MLGALSVSGLCLFGRVDAATDATRLFGPCVVCHQPNAGGSADGKIPSLAGQRARYLETQLRLFRAGARVDTAMQVVAAHPAFADHANVTLLATYLSRLPPNPSPVHGSGEHLRVAQELYSHICAACHGVDGQGNDANMVPRIAGQHAPYLRRQIESAAEWHRQLAPPEMTAALRSMRAAEKDALADFISRLGSPGELLNGTVPPPAQGPGPSRP